jgi:hypothetical protein
MTVDGITGGIRPLATLAKQISWYSNALANPVRLPAIRCNTR